ncbi:hypothetical protein DYB25_008838 [Aphanomyces astaci]|uniref:HECT domain-containing protein n=3 Tax=Aphanomyces astaci TaxID=112090 RepID=A0A397FEQ8_APHAT|nr:hypothetical protein DYB25_008838 [Aphanomyces astaci]RHY69200.1 hypothetical protein DYB30_008842 [Aphanomyces astaci]RHZ29991.1 hypothetical protein DYB31_006345 [Aphanomyces astaci]
MRKQWVRLHDIHGVVRWTRRFLDAAQVPDAHVIQMNTPPLPSTPPPLPPSSSGNLSPVVESPRTTHQSSIDCASPNDLLQKLNQAPTEDCRVIMWQPLDSTPANVTVLGSVVPPATASSLLEISKLPFYMKYAWFLHQVHDLVVPYDELHIKVKVMRDAIVQEAVENLVSYPPRALCAIVRYEFTGESAQDAGAVQREWCYLCPISGSITLGRYMLVSEGLLVEANGLFVVLNREDNSYFINPNSSHAWRLLYLLEHDNAQDLALTFSVSETHGHNTVVEVELVENGHLRGVTDANKAEYVRLMVRYLVFGRVEAQLSALLQGVYDVVPPELLMPFDHKELILCGLAEVDVADWKANTVTSSNLDNSSPLQVVPTMTKTFDAQDTLPKLPIPELADSLKHYARSVSVLQTPEEHAATQKKIDSFLAHDGAALQEKLIEYAKDKNSFIEDFWYEAYFNYKASVVLNVNPFFVLEDDPTPSRANQVSRATSLIVSSLKVPTYFIHALRTETMKPDVWRTTPLCMNQFRMLFATARCPTETNDAVQVAPNSKHIVIVCRNQFYWFDVMWEDGTAAITEREIMDNLRRIVDDANSRPPATVSSSAVGVLTTEHRVSWAKLRKIDRALFLVCLDHTSPPTASDFASTALHGTYEIVQGHQTGTCMNRWYDKLQIIVCDNGVAGVNFEHSVVDGHTVLRFASDVFTDTVIRYSSVL